MKRVFIICLSFFLLLTAYLPAEAAYKFSENSGLKEMGTATELGKGGITTPESYVGMILSLFFSFLGLIFLILTIYAGIQWMTAQGNNSQVEKAKETLIRAIVGLVIVMAAYGITYFVMNMFQQPSDSTIIDGNSGLQTEDYYYQQYGN